ncbi:MAG: hypothetical protein WBQ60_08850 [Asticcacaulis sp.]
MKKAPKSMEALNHAKADLRTTRFMSLRPSFIERGKANGKWPLGAIWPVNTLNSSVSETPKFPKIAVELGSISV